MLQNDVQILEAARVMAEKMVSENPDDKDYVSKVFKRILVRSPKKEELLTLTAYYHDALKTYSENIGGEAEKLVAVGNYEKLDVNPSKTAALMLTAQVIYNLDETITKE